MKIAEVITPIVAYHGTTDDITQFRPLTHFGTEKAARDRMDYKKNKNGKIYKVQLDIRNPFTIKDFPGIHYDRVYAFELRDKKKISQEEMEAITMLQDPAELRAALLAKVKELGYDGFVYKNRYEDKGNISYVILDPSQAKILEVIPVGEDVAESAETRLTLKSAIKDFLPIAVKHLNLKSLPKIKLVKDIKGSHVPTFGRFVNKEKVIYLDVENRHPIDIIRTLAHELVHFEQGQEHELSSGSWHTGSPIEDEAHMEAGVMMRKFDKKFPEYFKAEPNMWEPKNENFADGKKPGRKGLAKRMGVDCSKSETELRKIAANSSGEKQRMAHWCANMKGGKR